MTAAIAFFTADTMHRYIYGWQWMWCMPHMIHCALVQALGTQLVGSKCTNNEARELITVMRVAVRHVNSSTILSKTFTSWQEEQIHREMTDAESIRLEEVSSKLLDLQILRRRTQNLKQDVSQRLVHTQAVSIASARGC